MKRQVISFKNANSDKSKSKALYTPSSHQVKHVSGFLKKNTIFSSMDSSDHNRESGHLLSLFKSEDDRGAPYLLQPGYKQQNEGEKGMKLQGVARQSTGSREGSQSRERQEEYLVCGARSVLEGSQSVLNSRSFITMVRERMSPSQSKLKLVETGYSDLEYHKAASGRKARQAEALAGEVARWQDRYEEQVQTNRQLSLQIRELERERASTDGNQHKREVDSLRQQLRTLQETNGAKMELASPEREELYRRQAKTIQEYAEAMDEMALEYEKRLVTMKTELIRRYEEEYRAEKASWQARERDLQASNQFLSEVVKEYEARLGLQPRSVKEASHSSSLKATPPPSDMPGESLQIQKAQVSKTLLSLQQAVEMKCLEVGSLKQKLMAISKGASKSNGALALKKTAHQQNNGTMLHSIINSLANQVDKLAAGKERSLLRESSEMSLSKGTRERSTYL